MNRDIKLDVIPINKENFIEYVIDNNYHYEETKTEIIISQIVDELENFNRSISYNKKDKDILLWTEKNGSGVSHRLNKFEIECICYFNKINKGE